MAFAQSISRIGNSPYPTSVTPDTLFMVNMAAMSQTQQLTVVTLQGLTARVKPKIMVNLGTTGYITDLTNNYGIVYDSAYFTDFRGLITHFSAGLNGYILCNNDDSSTDAAISICPMLSAIVVNPPDTALMDSIGVGQVYSTIYKGESWSFDTFQNSYNKRIITSQDPAKNTFVTDYSIFAGGFDFWDVPISSRAMSYFGSMGINGAVFGWNNEHLLVYAASTNSLHVHASDFSSNLCVYSNFSIPAQHQVNHTDDTVFKPGVHTVCFVMTDGDNLQWLGGAFEDVQWYGNPHRGQVNLGWTISPVLAELGPTMMKYIYDSASSSPAGNDEFICAASGLGYSYPNDFGVPDSGAAITGRIMQKANLSILNVIADSYSPAEMAPYLAEPGIEAVFFYTYANDYFGLHGSTDCIYGKPVISGRFNLNSNDYSTYTLAAAINAMPKNPYSPDGYSLIPVNVWSSTIDSVIKCVQMLDSNVRVVTPESFVRLYMAGNNCIPQSTFGIKNVSATDGVSVYNEPNPCSDHTQIVYTMPQPAQVQATLYDECGRQIKPLFSDYSAEGTHSVDIDTHDLTQGLYYYTLRGDYFTVTGKCLVIR
jgi:hypothetical protein